MNELETLREELRERLPGAEVEVDAPADPDGTWWLDVEMEGHRVAVEWRSGGGFGVTTLPCDSFGEGFDELLEDVGQTAERVGELLRSGEQTKAPRDVLLQRLREERDLTR